MKICFLLNNYTFVGGVERLTCMLTNELSKNNKVDIISLYDTSEKCPYIFNQSININVLYKKSEKNYFLETFPSIKKIRNIIKKEKYDYLIYAGELLSHYALMACRNTNTKCVGWGHSPALYYGESFLQKPTKRLMIKKSDFVITLTKDSVDKYKQKYNVENVFSIPNPIDPILLEMETKYDYESKKIISVGRICNEKNYDELIRVANIVFSKLDGWTWDIYGDGDTKLKNVLLDLVKNNNLEGKINFLGSKKNIYDLYDHYSILVMTSKSEGFPMVLLEAIAKKIPMISYDISTGPSELIQNDINGFLIEPFNTEKMANKIIELANDPEKRKTMSNNNDLIINKYNISKIANEWEELLSSQLKN